MTPGNYAKLRLVTFNLDCDATVANRTAYIRQFKEAAELSGAGIVHASAYEAQTAGEDHHHIVVFGPEMNNGMITGSAPAHGGSFTQVWGSAQPIFEGEFTLAIGAEGKVAGDATGNVEIQYWDGPLDLVATAR